MGAEFCKTLAQAGAQVVIADIDGEAALTLGRLPRSGLACRQGKPAQSSTRRAIGVPTDVTSPQSVRELVNRTLAEFGRLDILVNSAALDPKFDP